MSAPAERFLLDWMPEMRTIYGPPQPENPDEPDGVVGYEVSDQDVLGLPLEVQELVDDLLYKEDVTCSQPGCGQHLGWYYDEAVDVNGNERAVNGWDPAVLVWGPDQDPAAYCEEHGGDTHA